MLSRISIRGVFLLIAFSVAAGCAGSGGKFSRTRTADVAYFADTSIALVGDTSFGLSRDDAVYTRNLFSPEGEEEQRLRGKITELNEYLEVTVAYSLRIVDIAETADSEAETVAQYADYLVTVSDWVERNFDMDDGRYDEIVETVRAQQTFLAALREAQPIVNAYGRYGEALIEEIDTATEALVLKIDGLIDAQYIDVVNYQVALREERSAILRALAALHKTYRGDPGAYDELRSSDAIIDKTIVPDVDSPTEQQLTEIAQYLQTRLHRLRLIEDEIEREWTDYRESHRELDRMHEYFDTERNRARLVFLVWIRAHKNMASGKVDPAEWFDISTVSEALLKAGTRAIF